MFPTSTFRLTFFDRVLSAQCSVKKSQSKCGSWGDLKILPYNITTLIVPKLKRYKSAEKPWRFIVQKLKFLLISFVSLIVGTNHQKTSAKNHILFGHLSICGSKCNSSTYLILFKSCLSKSKFESRPFISDNMNIQTTMHRAASVHHMRCARKLVTYMS